MLMELCLSCQLPHPCESLIPGINRLNRYVVLNSLFLCHMVNGFSNVVQPNCIIRSGVMDVNHIAENFKNVGTDRIIPAQQSVPAYQQQLGRGSYLARACMSPLAYMTERE